MNTKCIYWAMMALGAVLTSAQRCPYRMDIAPCVCTESEKLAMDCSRVVDIAQLIRIFEADFPSTTFWRLTMTGTYDAPIQLSFLPDGVFGSVNFQEILIQHTLIQRVDDYAFVGSKDSLSMLWITHSELTSFPTTILPLMPNLMQLDLSYNLLQFLPDLRSSSLRSLTLAHNSQLAFTDQLFTKLDQIVDLNIGYCQVETLTPGIFLNMMNLSSLYLEHNRLTHLAAASLHFTSGAMEEIVLSGNQITSVDPNFLSGTGKHAYLMLVNNQITTLAEATWRPVFQDISEPGDGMVMLDGNRLECGCSLAWLVASPSFLSHLAYGAACANGTAIHDLDPDSLQHDCSS
ncbi:Oplophorus-luciferin 2-monooxygenase non-catalytic subunit [Chionoecetes opilio]|uniref:Oplophorus-luciferin 2-monooxygenase non-catalytic subunit n=1 Tax=Chionoecetes opilio TaxID=41210 RepID=A0A8J5CI00_CHIOP|nr:Oplophorus-luciferin 2-monooxygenase non-catalytic subunit [Chionoecetes opilio]